MSPRSHDHSLRHALGAPGSVLRATAALLLATAPLLRATAPLLLATASIGACSGEIGSRLSLNVTDASGAGGQQDASGAGGFEPGDDAGTGGTQQCAGVENEATKIPVSMFIAVDKSGSMEDSNKWNNAKSAFSKFFVDPAADSLNVALRFWPDAGCDTSCNVATCAMPQAPLGSLADQAHEQALVNLFNAKTPGGPTPMDAALAGATEWAIEQQAQAGTSEKVVVVLVTDGEPNGCNENINAIAKHAENAYAKAQILTFAVGMQGSNEAQMDVIAKAGMTTAGFFIGNGNAEAELLLALKAIQESIVACSYTMPISDDPDQVVDPAQVNLSYTPGDGGATVDFTQVASENACAGGQEAWYYDDPNAPTAIVLCPAACEKVQADDAAKIKVVLGCATKVK
ncbi:MAG: VWA domain-containing protein [Myxococcales bacterium]|nr:VWA domain-containing protein [Myxococcales bacterium]